MSFADLRVIHNQAIEIKRLNATMKRQTDLLQLSVAKKDVRIKYLEKRLDFYKQKVITIAKRGNK